MSAGQNHIAVRPGFLDLTGCSWRQAIGDSTRWLIQAGAPISSAILRVGIGDAERIRTELGNDCALFWDRPGMKVRTPIGPLSIEVLDTGDPWATPEPVVLVEGAEVLTLRMR